MYEIGKSFGHRFKWAFLGIRNNVKVEDQQMWEKIKEKSFFVFIGLDSRRDEYQVEKIRYLLSKTGIGLWLSNMGLLIILLIQDQLRHEVSFATIALLIITTVSSGYVMFELYRQGLNITEFETEEEFKRYRWRALGRAYLQGAYLGLIVYLLTSVIFPLILNEALVLKLSELFKAVAISSVSVGSILAVFIYFRLKKYDEE